MVDTTLIKIFQPKNKLAIQNFITDIDREVTQLVIDYNGAEQFANTSLTLSSYPDCEELLGDSIDIDQLRNTAFSWREEIRPKIMQCITSMRSFYTSYTSYFRDMSQEIKVTLVAEEYKAILIESFEEIFSYLSKVTVFFNKLIEPVQVFMTQIEKNKKKINERLLPNLEKTGEKLQDKLDENFKNLRICLAQLKGLPKPSARSLRLASKVPDLSDLNDKREILDELLNLLNEYITLKPKVASYQAMKNTLQKLLASNFTLFRLIQNLGKIWKQCEQEITHEKEKLTSQEFTIDANDVNKVDEQGTAKRIEQRITGSKQEKSEIPTELQQTYTFFETINTEFERLEKKLKRYELHFASI